MTVEEALAEIREWTGGMQFHKNSRGVGMAALVLADEVERFRKHLEDVDELEETTWTGI